MANRIYRLTDRALSECMDWDTAIYNGEIETVAEYDSYQDAVTAFNDGNYDCDLYGVE